MFDSLSSIITFTSIFLYFFTSDSNCETISYTGTVVAINDTKALFYNGFTVFSDITNNCKQYDFDKTLYFPTFSVI